MIFAGGMPLRCGDRIVGAVGVSGGSGEQDQAVAEAAAAALGAFVHLLGTGLDLVIRVAAVPARR